MWRASIARGIATGTLRRDRVAVVAALVTAVVVFLGFVFSHGTEALMPGRLTHAHAAIENCSSCHSKTGTNKLSWVHGLVAGDPIADSKACLTCHKMPDTAFNAHGAPNDVLKASTKRLTGLAAKMSVPVSARAQHAAFPTEGMHEAGLPCATCHQEHQGAAFNLKAVSNAQCRSCHSVKFESFDTDHPKFEGYPFKRRTRIVFDHAGHFGKHYPEVAKKDPAKRIPATCSTCHDSRDDRRVMSVLPFEKTCAGCHRDQITGKERASGPKGVAFISLPGLDMATLKKKNAAVGEWPDDSDARLTPFMKVMISRTDRGRTLLKAVDGLNLQDLSAATDAQISAVTEIAWEVKSLINALLTGKASDALGNLDFDGGAQLSATLVSDLTANIPRDVIASAQQEWLPNLAAEAASRPAPVKPATEPVNPVAKPVVKPAPAAVNDTPAAATTSSDDKKAVRPFKELPPAMKAGAKSADDARAQSDSKEGAASHGNDDGRWDLPSGTPRSIRQRREGPEDDKGSSGRAKTPSDDSAGDKPAADSPTSPKSGEGDQPAAPAAAADSPPGDQSDDLLFPTEAEQREMKTLTKDGGSQPAAAANDTPAAATSKATDAGEPAANAKVPEAAASRTSKPAVVAIGSDIDPESWAESGGWYRQDYTIFYRPQGHKDKFIYSWLFLSGPKAPRNDKSPMTAVFETLTGKDAQGSCTKCHSVDDLAGKGRLVNFSPPSAKTKKVRFTAFVHEPHFGIMEDRGCLTCHTLEKDRAYLKSYEHGDAKQFASNFGEVKQELCKGCHNASAVRQDCGLCHKYHVNGVETPIISTKIPSQ